MVIIYCYLKRENCKVLKFNRDNYSYFKISAFLFQTSPSISYAPYSFEIK